MNTEWFILGVVGLALLALALIERKP